MSIADFRGGEVRMAYLAGPLQVSLSLLNFPIDPKRVLDRLCSAHLSQHKTD